MAENRTYSAKVRLVEEPLKIKVDGVKVKFIYDNQFATFEIGKGKEVEITYKEKKQWKLFQQKIVKFFEN